jgi:hypothetical protein
VRRHQEIRDHALAWSSTSPVPAKRFARKERGPGVQRFELDPERQEKGTHRIERFETCTDFGPHHIACHERAIDLRSQ